MLAAGERAGGEDDESDEGGDGDDGVASGEGDEDADRGRRAGPAQLRLLRRV